MAIDEQARLDRLGDKLQSKYSKTRNINQEKLMKKRGIKEVFSAIFSVILSLVFLYSLVFAVGVFSSRVCKTAPSLMGYTYMQVKTGSMTAESIQIGEGVYSSGFNVGDKILIRRVETHSLKVGDKIAFYVDEKSSTSFDRENAEVVDNSDVALKTSFTFGDLFGFQSNLVMKSAKSGSQLVFHHIYSILEDENGTWWFKTQGSSNEFEDYWTVNEGYVLGVYDDTQGGQTMMGILDFITSKVGLFVTILIPLLLIASLIIVDLCKNLSLAKLEWDCVEEKRKITDEICVKNNIGYRMSNSTKYKILAQAEDDETALYISLLWRDGSAPNSIKKYYTRKRIILRRNKQLLLLNRQCEEMIKNGEDKIKVATYYDGQKREIEEREAEARKRFKELARAREKENISGKEN